MIYRNDALLLFFPLFSVFPLLNATNDATLFANLDDFQARVSTSLFEKLKQRNDISFV